VSNEAKGPYYFTQPDNDGFAYVFARGNPDWILAYDTENRSENARFAGDVCSLINSALTTQAARVRELEEDREWLRSQWERHRKALNAIAWGEYDNVAFCRRLAQDELAIGVKVANDRAAATVAALTPKEPQQ